MAESGLGHNKRSDREVAWREGDRVETPSGIGRVVDPNYPIGAAGATICPTRVQVALESGLVLFDDDQLTRIEG